MGQVVDRPPELEGGPGMKSSPSPPSYKKGGKVKKTGLARLHKGETVVPKGSAKSGGMKR